MSHDVVHTLAAAQEKFNAGQFDEAAQLFQGILAIDAGNGEALEALGYIAARKGDHPSAAAYVTRAAECLPMSAQQLHVAAQICQLAERHDDAVALFERCLAKLPHHAASLNGAAISLLQLGDRARARQMLARLRDAHPASAEAHYNRGTLLGRMDLHDEEIAAYKAAIAIEPEFVNAHVNLGAALCDQHRFDDAMKQFKKAISLAPNDAGARCIRAQTNLLLGEYAHGWREYEWRWRGDAPTHGFPEASLWTGAQPISGKTLLVHHEQGFGDTLQFVRFVDRLQASGARVVLRVQEALLPLLRSCPGAAEVVGEHAPLPSFDFHIPLLSLPFALGAREPDFARAGPYVRADPALVAQWGEVFARSPGRRPRVGIAWSGNPTFRNDRKRSLSLSLIEPLFGADVDFVSLQKDVRPGDRARLAQLVQQGALRDVSDRLVTFSDTAALIEHLDLVISSDTAVPHLAAALGKPVWVALSFVPDWRWLLDRNDSPWYPGMRLFRQSASENWPEVIADMRRELEAWASAGTARGAVG